MVIALLLYSNAACGRAIFIAEELNLLLMNSKLISTVNSAYVE
jgi:hypothetical protein